MVLTLFDLLLNSLFDLLSASCQRCQIVRQYWLIHLDPDAVAFRVLSIVVSLTSFFRARRKQHVKNIR